MRTASIVLALAACSSPGGESSPDAGAGSSDDAPTSGVSPTLPQPTGTCPAIANGDVTFAPAGIPPRKVKLAIDAATTGGPLVLYWHATGSSPLEAAYALGSSVVDITSAGGVVATPYSDPAAGTFEWFIVNGSAKLDDFVLADEIVACLAQGNRIDPSHVHSVGMSAGGLQTTATSFLRSSYIASVATFSGGMPDGFAPIPQRADNKFAALIFAGGASDNVFGVDFEAASERYRSTLVANGHFAALCDHGNGHEIPTNVGASVTAFFAANGFGVWPSPYASGLPSTFPSYCAR
jgi:poly(3-hydroxybutyrate) depolymerase